MLSVGAALITAEAVIYLLAAHAGLTVNAQSAGILDVLVFGAGTDYALLLTARYREELRRHADRHEAMAVAIRRAGPAIVASGGTVLLSLLTLSLASLNSTSSMGPVLAIGVAIALASMMTLLPALLVATGRWVFWPIKPAFGSDEPTTRGLWARTGRRIARRPRLVWVGTTLVLGAMAIGLAGLHAGGLTTAQSFRGHPGLGDRADRARRALPWRRRAAGAGVRQPRLRAAAGGRARLRPRPHRGHQAAGPSPATTTWRPRSPPRPTARPPMTTIDRARAAAHAVPGADAHRRREHRGQPGRAAGGGARPER